MRQKFVHFLSVSSTRPRVLVALATVVALAVGGTVAGYAALTTSVPGHPRRRDPRGLLTGDTVAEVLASEGIEITEHDLVAPELDEPVAEGSRIVVRFGRPVELTVDGETATHWVTSTDVASALGELGTPYDRAELSATRSAAIGRDGLALQVVTPKNLTLRIAGAKPVTQAVTALTVEEALDRARRQGRQGRPHRAEPRDRAAGRRPGRLHRLPDRQAQGQPRADPVRDRRDAGRLDVRGRLSETEREGGPAPAT